MISLLPGRQLTDDVVRTLRTIQTSAYNARNGPSQQGLGMWVDEAERQLRHLVPVAEIDRLVLTPRCRAIMLGSGSPQMTRNVMAELDDAVVRWDAEMSELEGWRSHWRAGDRAVAADTNVYLHHPQRFEMVDWHEIAARPRDESLRFVVPLVVLDELDNSKRNPKGAVRTRARLTVRTIAGLLDDGRSDGARVGQRGAHLGSLPFDVLPDPSPRHVRSPRSDDEIVERLAALRDLACKPVTLVTYDVGMSFRARQAGLDVVLLTEQDDD